MSRKVQKGSVNQRQRLAALLLSSGVTQREVAELVGVAEQTVGRWKKQETFKKLLAERMAEVEGEVAKARDILIEGAVLAALKELDSLKSEDEAIALRAAGEILDRVGIAKVTKVEEVSDTRVRLRWGDVYEDSMAGPSASSQGPGSGSEASGQVQSSGSGKAVGKD